LHRSSIFSLFLFS